MLYSEDIKKCESFVDLIGEIEPNYKLDISTDSRSINPGQTFLAITGEKFNAMNFLNSIVDKKVKLVIYTDTSENNQIVEKYKNDFVFIKTKNSILFLQEITRILSDRFQDNGGKLIAISGSNGKTTTKEMLYHLLKTVHPETICTQKNNNNHIGVPLTLLQITSKTKYAIVELGSNHPGEIETLCNIVNPKYGVTTNIGDTHLEFFENRENVFKEEGYLYYAVKNCGKEKNLFFQNIDDEFLQTLDREDFVSTYGLCPSDDQFFIDKEKLLIKNNSHEYTLNNRFITGKHNFYNLCLAFVVAKSLDPANTQKFISSCENFKPTANRSEWIVKDNSKIFLDAYNANPSSMRAAIDGFLDVAGKDYCLIIGDMNELGRGASKYHADLATELRGRGIKNIYFVGRHANDFQSGYSDAKVYSTAKELKSEFLKSILNNYKYIFIKGSRSLQLESILDITLH